MLFKCKLYQAAPLRRLYGIKSVGDNIDQRPTEPYVAAGDRCSFGSDDQPHLTGTVHRLYEGNDPFRYELLEGDFVRKVGRVLVPVQCVKKCGRLPVDVLGNLAEVVH